MSLDVGAIERELVRLGAAARPLTVARDTSSTSDDARAAAAAGAPDGAAFLADAQSVGRGRGSHTWHSPPGENVYLSMVLRPRVDPRQVAQIALVVGVAVARVVKGRLGADAGVDVALKWPNDVLVGGRKIAGVLVEGQLRGDQVQSLVAGVGLNVRTERFPPEIASRATSLALVGAADLDRSRLAAALIAGIDASVRAFEESGLASVAEELGRLDALAGREVVAGERRGIACGIDRQGRLLLRDGEGCVHAIVAGEVSASDPVEKVQ